MNRRGASRHTGNPPLLSIIGRRHFSVAEARHDQRHPGRRHQWSGHLIEELIGIFLLGKGPLQELDKRGQFQLLRQVAHRGRGVAGDFIVIDLLSGTDQRLPIELNRLTPPPPAMAMRGSASANSRLNFIGAR